MPGGALARRRVGRGGGARAVAAACALLGAIPAHAQNRGVYPLGMSATSSGITPPAGFTYSNQLLFYARDEVKDDHGATLPIGGLNAVLMDLNSLTWASDGTTLGARYSATITIPVARNSLTSDVHGEISGGSGLADSYFLPVILGWGGDRVAVRAMYGFLAPTGRFAADASDNVGSGYWTHTLSSGQTVFLTRDRTFTLSAFEVYEFHTTQEGTGVHPGQTLDLDYSLMGALPLRGGLRVQIGLAGYVQRQMTATTGPDVTPASSEERYAVNGLGVAVTAALPKPKASFGLKLFDEFENRATFEGYSVQLSGAISF